jgi:hypothetical protein
MYMFSLIPPHIYVSMCVYVYVHISLFLPECVFTTIIDISPRIFSLMYCCWNKVLLVSSADRPCFDVAGKGRDKQTCNIVWNIERDQSFWITSSEHQGTMPKGLCSFSCSMQVIQFADIQFHLIK